MPHLPFTVPKRNWDLYQRDHSKTLRPKRNLAADSQYVDVIRDLSEKVKPHQRIKESAIRAKRKKQ
ncbi:hypothetical protein ACFL6U_01555 [Planctomycetota bacterium]